MARTYILDPLLRLGLKIWTTSVQWGRELNIMNGITLETFKQAFFAVLRVNDRLPSEIARLRDLQVKPDKPRLKRTFVDWLLRRP